MDTLKEQKTLKPFILHLTTPGQVVVSPAPISHTAISPVNLADSRLKELLNKVLFENCTPEEAASSVGVPVASVRQQLRLAMHQLRASQKA